MEHPGNGQGCCRAPTGSVTTSWSFLFFEPPPFGVVAGGDLGNSFGAQVSGGDGGVDKTGCAAPANPDESPHNNHSATASLGPSDGVRLRFSSLLRGASSEVDAWASGGIQPTGLAELCGRASRSQTIEFSATPAHLDASNLEGQRTSGAEDVGGLTSSEGAGGAGKALRAGMSV